MADDFASVIEERNKSFHREESFPAPGSFAANDDEAYPPVNGDDAHDAGSEASSEEAPIDASEDPEGYWKNVVTEMQERHVPQVEITEAEEEEEEEEEEVQIPVPAPRGSQVSKEEQEESLNYWEGQSNGHQEESSGPAVVTIVEPSKPESEMSNAEVLSKMVEDGEVEEDDMASVRQLLAAAKKTRRPKTETFIVRAKNREDSIRKAIDVSAMSIVIEDAMSQKKAGKAMDSGSRFEVSKSQAFQVRKTSIIQPLSETVVTREWITNAIKTYEQETKVELLDTSFTSKRDGDSLWYEAKIEAYVGTSFQKTYSWIIKPASPAASDKNTYIVGNLGSKIASFVASKHLKKPSSFPFRPVIYADKQYAIMDDLSAYRAVSNDHTGLDLDHMKVAVRTMAKLHAMSFAYFYRSADDVNAFSEVLRHMIDKNYQPSASSADKAQAKEELNAGFEKLLSLVRATGEEGVKLAEAARKKFGDRLLSIFTEANASTSSFSVLCHGYPAPEHICFRYGDDKRPLDAKYTGFEQARYAHAVTDLQLLFCTAMGPRVEEQAEFLLRFIYYETLASMLKSLGVIPSNVPDFDVLRKDFKKKHAFGCLAGGMHLAEVAGTAAGGARGGAAGLRGASMKRASGKRVFESKFIGHVAPATQREKQEKEVYQASGPALRAKILLERAVALR